MQKAAFLMAVLLLSAVWVVAQTAATGQAGTPTQSPSQNSSMSQSSGTSQNPQTQTGTATGQIPGNAQSGTNPAGAPPTASGPSQTLEGCLSGTPGEYSLITKSGQAYALSGDGSLLGNHVGQEVKLTGAQSNVGATGAAGAQPGSSTPGTAAGGTPYGSTGTTGSQPGATTQSQTGTSPGQAGAPARQPGSAAGSPAASGQPQSSTPAMGSGPGFQVSSLDKVSEFCNMPKPH